MHKRLKILHITPWYPNAESPYEALWIKRHIDSVREYAEHEVLHINIGHGRIRIKRYDTDENEKHLVIHIPFRQWFFIELSWFFTLFFYLGFKRVGRGRDVIHFHVAYPALTHWHLLKKLVKCPVLLTEHWSAYHFNFGVNDVKKLTRIKKIFSHKIPLITVSKALALDIEKFCGGRDYRSYVLPNVVDTSLFKYDRQSQGRQFFMVSQWNWPKDPILFVNSFAKFLDANAFAYHLRIGGFGVQWTALKEEVAKLGIQRNVTFLGSLSSQQIADEMQRAIAFVHCSWYETFSVVCAEALCCGTPVVASNVGGLSEFVAESNGILIENNVDNWFNALNAVVTRQYDRERIATMAQSKFSSDKVGLRYFQILHETSCDNQ